jgi:hypothetical protein
MNEKQRDELIGTLRHPEQARAMLAEFEDAGEPLRLAYWRSKPKQAKHWPDDWDDWKVTEARDELERAGVIRRTGKFKGHGAARSAYYALTPLAEIERQRERYEDERRGKRRKPDPEVREWRQRAQRYRSEEKALGTKAGVRWLQAKRKILELCVELKRVDRMLFWKAVKDHELADVYEDVYDLKLWAERTLNSIDRSRTTKAQWERIEQFRKTEGRTEIEAQIFRARADREEEKLRA